MFNNKTQIRRIRAVACRQRGADSRPIREIRGEAVPGGSDLSVATAVRVEGPIDRVHYATPDVVEMHDRTRIPRIETRGFRDTAVWNPGAGGTRTRADFADGDEVRMVCVEAAVVRPPLLLAPSEQWGERSLRPRCDNGRRARKQCGVIGGMIHQ